MIEDRETLRRVLCGVGSRQEADRVEQWILALESKLDAILDSIRQCAGNLPFDSGGRHGMYCSECGQYESTGRHLDNCWRRFAFPEPPK